MNMAVQSLYGNRLYRIDLLIEREILRLRCRYQLSLDEFRGLYISDRQVDQILNRRMHSDEDPEYLDQLSQQLQSLQDAQEPGPLQHLADNFDLNTLERDLLFLALAPELDLKYETLYAYLNDDVGKKWPTLHIAQRLLDERSMTGNAVRLALTPSSTLVRERLVTLGERGTGLRSTNHQGFTLTPAVVQFLLDLPPGTALLSGCTTRSTHTLEWQSIQLMGPLRETLRRLPSVLKQAGPPIIVFAGDVGSGKRQAARALAAEMGEPLLGFDVAAMPHGEEAAVFDALALELKLWPALLHITGIESLVDSEGRPSPIAAMLSRWLRVWSGPVVLDIPTGFAWRRLFPEGRGLEFAFGQGGYDQRAVLWRILPEQYGIQLTAAESASLAGRFDFTAGQIASVLANAGDMARLRANGEGAKTGYNHIMSSARAGSGQHLGSLATKVRCRQRWDDLVLTPTTLGRVREFSAAVRQRHVVFAEWGFAERLDHTGSLVALFSGVSGTGKTMTAGVIADELEIDLYKVDLSGLVSKYIGETEKNLDRVFDVARKGNAMLFFDEADALFGKRSEVKDAHDRYANIETAYLLQKVEEHPGVVILATNIKRNIDEAFARRLHYVIEFPMPEIRERERLWRGMFPEAAPLDEEIDIGFLARQFSLSGGNIRNVVLDAAFLAAHCEAQIEMRHIIQALGRQYAKQGKIPSPNEFGQYHSLLNVEHAVQT